MSMADVTAIWAEVMPNVKNTVTGVGLWTALNQSKAIAMEDKTFVLGLPHESGDLAGHLRMQATKLLIEKALGEKLQKEIDLRIIEGTSTQDWEIAKRKDEESRRMQMAAMQRVQAEIQARSSWESVFEDLSRHWASLTNKSLPQNRGEFLEKSLAVLADGLSRNPINDDLAERNFARCIERVSQYTEVPSAVVAYLLKQSLGK